MKKKLLSMILSLTMGVTMMPAMAMAAFAEEGSGSILSANISEGEAAADVESEEKSDAEILLAALSGKEQGSVEGVIEVEDIEFSDYHRVSLLKNIDLGSENIVIADSVFFDLNHFNITTAGTVENTGTVILHQENADVIDYLLYNAPGNYATDEELKLPNDEDPDYVIPENTFMTAEVGKDPAYQKLGFAIGDDTLVWKKDVPAGMQLDVVYNLALGGDILGAKSDGIMPTKVKANDFSLMDDISIGGSDGEGEAVLQIESLYDDFIGDDVGTFVANSHKITINRSGKLILSSDIVFDESVLVSGIEGMEVSSLKDQKAGTTTYFIDPFKDVPKDAWYYNSVMKVYSSGLMNGTSATAFSPDGILNRAMFVTILGRFANVDESKYPGSSFKDVETDQWYSAYIEWAYQEGITKGVGNGRFGYDSPVSREEMATFIARYVENEDLTLSDDPDPVESFKDQDKVNSWAEDALELMRKSGIIKGDEKGYFNPQANATRAQAAAIFDRLDAAL